MSRDHLTRRRVIALTGAVAAGTALAGCTEGDSSTDDPGGNAGGATDEPGGNGGEEQPFGDWFTEDAKGGATDNYDGAVADRTGQDAVTVEVGADGNGGELAFAPAAVRVDGGTTVTFEWVSDTHNILVEDQPDGAGWGGVESIENTGFTHEHTFETAGTYTYYCDPHLSMGMKGAVVVE